MATQSLLNVTGESLFPTCGLQENPLGICGLEEVSATCGLEEAPSVIESGTVSSLYGRATGYAGSFLPKWGETSWHSKAGSFIGYSAGTMAGRLTKRVVSSPAKFIFGDTAGNLIGSGAGIYAWYKTSQLVGGYAATAFQMTGTAASSLGITGTMALTGAGVVLGGLVGLGGLAWLYSKYRAHKRRTEFVSLTDLQRERAIESRRLGARGAAFPEDRVVLGGLVGLGGLAWLYSNFPEDRVVLGRLVGLGGLAWLYSKYRAHKRRTEFVSLTDLQRERAIESRRLGARGAAFPEDRFEKEIEFPGHDHRQWGTIFQREGDSEETSRQLFQLIAVENEGIRESGGYTAYDGSRIITESYKQSIRDSFTVRVRGRVRDRVRREKFQRLGYIPSTRRFRTAEQFQVVEGDCIDIYSMLQREGFRPALLNNANDQKATGGYYRGADAQEEDLCIRILGLPGSLKQIEREGRNGRFYNSERDCSVCIYTPQGSVIRANKRDGYRLLPAREVFKVDVITSAAPDLGSRREASEIRRNYEIYAKTQIQIAIETGHDTLVVAAWGCGVFGNDPETIERCYREVCKAHFPGQIKIVFSILGRRNLDGFRRGIQASSRERSRDVRRTVRFADERGSDRSRSSRGGRSRIDTRVADVL